MGTVQKDGSRIENYERFFSKKAKRTHHTALRSYQKYVNDQYIYMAGGFPNADLFPITQMKITLDDGHSVSLEEREMRVAQQYGDTPGVVPLLNWLGDLQRRLHNPPTLPPPGVSPATNSDLDITTCSGSQEVMSLVMAAVIDEGDSILLEESTYPTIINCIEPHGGKYIPIRLDNFGMVSDDLDRVLSNWNEGTSGRRPKIIYLVPVGGNPTGVNMSFQRKKEIYAIASKYDILILEDDPYYMLQFDSPTLIPSFLSMDVDGRVLRADSFSKVIAPGFRLGYLSGPKEIVRKVVQAMECSSGSCNNISQHVMLKVVQHLGHDGFIARGRQAVEFYTKRRTLITSIVNKHLKGLVEFNIPAGGLFLWMKMKGVVDSAAVCEKVIEKGAVFVKGCLFYPVPASTPYIRINFSYATQTDMEKAFQWLGEVLRQETMTQNGKL